MLFRFLSWLSEGGKTGNKILKSKKLKRKDAKFAKSIILLILQENSQSVKTQAFLDIIDNKIFKVF